MNRRLGRPQLPSLLDRSGGYGETPYDRRGGGGSFGDSMRYGPFSDESRFERYAQEIFGEGGTPRYGFGGGGVANGTSYGEKKFENDRADDALPVDKEEILKDLGKTLYDSLKEGRNLAKNPVVREKIVTLLKSEENLEPEKAAEFGMLGKKKAAAAADPYSKYDAYYEDSVPPKSFGSVGGGFGAKKPRLGIGYEDSARGGFGFDGPPRGFGFDGPPRGFGFDGPPGGFGFDGPPRGFGFDGPPGGFGNSWGGFDGPRGGYGTDVSHTGGTSKLSQQFARVSNNEDDPHRIWASERELLIFLRDSPSILDRSLRNRLKNTISFEASRERNPKRRHWLNVQYDLLIRAKVYGKLAGPNVPENAPASTKRKYSARKLEIKRLRDKRPPQDENDRYMTNYLKSLLFELCGEQNRVHAVLILRAITQNPKMIRCLQQEVIKLLNEKFGAAPNLSMEASNAKRKFVMDHMKKHLADTKAHLLTIKKTTKFIFERESLFESIQPLLLGKEQPKEPLSVEDYVMEPNKTEAEFMNDYKYTFVRFAFEKFYFKVVEAFIPTKSVEKRINFFMNNGFIAGLIVDAVKEKVAPTLPSMAKKYVTNMDAACQETSAKIDDEIFKKILERGDVVSTNVEDYIANSALVTPEVLHYFKNCLTHFDWKLSVLKFQLLDYTNYIRLSREYKSYIFEEIIKFVYAQVLDMLVNNVSTAGKTYSDMERD